MSWRTGGGAGTFYAFEMQNPTFDAYGQCQASFVILKRVSGVSTLLGSFTGDCRNGMTLRLVARPGMLLAYPGEGHMTRAWLEPLDSVAPGAVGAQSIGVSTRAGRVNLQWQGAADDGNGAGVARYRVLRDGAYLGESPTPDFEDDTVAADTSYYAYDSGTNAIGRLSSVTWNALGYSNFFRYTYAYNAAGSVTTLGLQVPVYDPPGEQRSPTVNIQAGYTWDNERRLTSMTHAGLADPLIYMYDEMGRPSSLTRTYNAHDGIDHLHHPDGPGVPLPGGAE